MKISCSSNEPLRRQLLEQRLRLLQIERVEALREPAVDRSKQFASLLRLALVAPEACKAHGGVEFPEFCLLPARDRARALEIGFCVRALPQISSISQIIAGSDIARGWDATAISSSGNCSGNSKTLRR